jgi:hypothetical protein
VHRQVSQVTGKVLARRPTTPRERREYAVTDHRGETPGENGAPVPRDLPDQQAHTGEDPWEVAPERAGSDVTDEDEGAPGTDVPDTDEAGTGRQGAPHSGTEPSDEREPSEHPVPDDPSG